MAIPQIPWEGGPSYYAQFPQMAARGWTDPAFFPIGVWLESVVVQNDIDLDKAAGLNTYVALVGGSDLTLVRNNGMSLIGDPVAGYGAETVGWFITDEADMIYGPGNDGWTGVDGPNNTCIPAQTVGGQCGFTVMNSKMAALPNDGRARYANYGKGIMFWDTDTAAAQFVNSYTHIVSNDTYWYTDDYLKYGIEGPTRIQGSGPISPASGLHELTDTECHRAANYGVSLERLRTLDGMDGQRQAVWAFVELGHPSSDINQPTVTGPQVAGAVWNSIIHEARGVIYFNHSFAGCISNHLLREQCGAGIRPTVTTVNSQIKSLAPVLNTQSYVWQFSPMLDTMIKKAPDGSWYVFAMLGAGVLPGMQVFTLPPWLSSRATIDVMFESRLVNVCHNTFADCFDSESTCHVYHVTPVSMPPTPRKPWSTMVGAFRRRLRTF